MRVCSMRDQKVVYSLTLEKKTLSEAASAVEVSVSKFRLVMQLDLYPRVADFYVLT